MGSASFGEQRGSREKEAKISIVQAFEEKEENPNSPGAQISGIN